VSYSKPFREIRHLISELQTNGLTIPDPVQAEQFFRRVGYYRSGAYRYVFRQLLPEAERDVRTRTFRSDTYTPGSSLDEVVKLEEFDARLRDICQMGLADFEVRVRAAIAHVLARRDIFAHTAKEHLDKEHVDDLAGSGVNTKFDEWSTTYTKAIADSKLEDFIAHLLVKYGPPLPIWAMVDVLSFGSLPYLYELMKRDDRTEVARMFGVNQERRFAAWLRSMVDFRNYCAHGSRLFNRHFKRGIGIVPGAIDVNLLGHVLKDNFSSSDRPYGRLYINAALLAYMLRTHASGSRWHLQFKTVVRKLPPRASGLIPVVDLEYNMGFPGSWDQLELWQ